MNKAIKNIAIMLLVTVSLQIIPESVLAKTINNPLKNNNLIKTTKVNKNAKIIGEIEEKRGENTKYFLKEDNTLEAVVYPQPVHYQDNGKWKEIDNTLEDGKDEGEDILGNKNSNFKFNFGKYSNSKKLVSIKKDKYKISWSLEGANKSQIQKDKINEEGLNEVIQKEADNIVNEDKDIKLKSAKEKDKIKETVKDNEKKKTVLNAQSSATYSEVFKNVDLQYVLQGNNLKENIILKDKQDKSEFTFNIDVQNIVAKLDKNIVRFFDKDNKDKEVFSLLAPFMVDKEGVSSDDIKISLKEDKKGYILTLIPSKEWLEAKDRVYPVKIDPPVTSSQDVNSIQDTFVCSRSDKSNNNYYNAVLLGVGSGIYGVNRSFIKFTLPSEITSADMVIDAKLYLALYDSNSIYTQVNVHKVLNDWNSQTLTWNNAPGFNSKIEDFQNVGGTTPKNFSWDITSIAKEWYSTGNNFGLMLKSNNDSGSYQDFLSSDTNPIYIGSRPLVGFSFVNNTGLESYWTYHSQDVGRAGTGYVNDYNGNLIFTHNDISMSGNRLPVSITHVYNENERGNNIGFGQGYRLNLSQKVYGVTISGTQYYVYEDEDGTRHYFKADNPSAMKADTLSDTELCKNSDGSFTLKDKKSNKINFNSAGTLINITDKNSNIQTIDYANGKISSVTDGAGRKTTLNYNAQGLLSEIVAPDSSKTAYGYTGNQLTSITYPDAKVSTYAFDGDNKLLGATNPSGYKMSYNYYGATPYRVSKVIENTTSGVLGNEVSISYGYNTTTFTDVKGKSDVYQFDNTGKTVSTKDPEGNAKYYKFENATNTTKLTTESKLEKTVINLAKDSGAEGDKSWAGTSDGGTGTSGYTSEEKHLSGRSLKITKSDNVSRQYMQEGVSVERGKTYTFSAYVKTSNISNGKNHGASLAVHYITGRGVYEGKWSSFLNGTNDWTRLSVTFTIPTDTTNESVILRPSLDDETGTAYFDDFQLEEGSIVNRLNLIEGGDLGGSGTIPDSWGNHGCESGDQIVTTTDGNHPSYLNGKVFRLNGGMGKDKRIGQSVFVSGVTGDTFDISGWAKGASVPNGVFAIQVAFITDGAPQWETISFNRDTGDWQYINDVIKAKSNYSRIDIYPSYLNNANEAYFDGIQLYKEEFGDSYTYDDKGNLISVVDNAKNKSTFEYSTNNDLVKSINPKGSEFKYEYDSKHNIAKATTAENVVYNFKYDNNGNPLSSTIGTDTAFIGSTSNYTANGNYISSIYDSFGNKASYNYDETKGTLSSSTDYNGKTTTYNYDAMNREKSVSKQVDGKTITNSYIYDNDRISKITHNGFDYNFEYDAFGNSTKISVGNVPLITNNYEARTGKLLDYTYGNGQKVTNIYDEYDKIIGKSYNGVTRNNYKFDANGNLGINEDIINGITYRYNYDISNRLTKIEESNGNYSTYGYDNNNNKNNLTEKVNGKSYGTSYSFDKDNKVTAVNYQRSGANSTAYAYDSFGRLLSKNTNTGVVGFNTTYNYAKGNISNTGVKYSGYVSSAWQAEVSDGNIVGTVGQNTALQGLKISLSNPPAGMKIKYQVHVAYIGWMDYVYDGTQAGQLGSNVQAVRIVLEGAPEGYHVQYQAHVQNKGWMDPVLDGEVSGTTGQSLNLEALKVTIIKPGSTDSTRLSSISNNGSTLSYTYDKNGNIETVTDGTKVIKYYYNELNELIREDNAILNKTITYSYDAGGNILNKSEYALTSGALGTATSTVPYVYGDTNWKDKLTSFNGKAITYDQIGNPLTYDGKTYTWEMGRRLKGITGTNLNISYKYNDSGIRTEKTVNGVTTKYHLLGDKVTFESNGTDNIYYTYDSEDSLLSMSLNDQEYYYIKNSQGDIIGLHDKTGAVVVNYVYDSWGKLISTTGSLASTVGVKNPYRYRGYRYDTETGLYYLQSRYYNPEFGRFINMDSIAGKVGDLLSHNVFAYCKNNPVNMADANGQFAWFIPIGIFVEKVMEAVILSVITYVTVRTAGQYIASSPSIQSFSAKSKAKSVPKAIPKVETKKPKPNYWEASYNKLTKGVDIGREISQKEAELRVNDNKSIMCSNSNKALQIARKFDGYYLEINKGKYGEEGFYPHYHITEEHGDPHIWFYPAG